MINELNIMRVFKNLALVKSQCGLNHGAEYSRIENRFQFHQGEDLPGSSGKAIGSYWEVKGIIARSARTGPSSVTAVSRKGKRRRSSLSQPLS